MAKEKKKEMEQRERKHIFTIFTKKNNLKIEDLINMSKKKERKEKTRKNNNNKNEKCEKNYLYIKCL